MIFKIYGERNSGTNFLTSLLKINFGSKYVFEDHLDLNTSICYFWKHGYPDQEFNKVNERIINIFIIRDLRKWLVSMYHNPYCLDYYNKNRTFDYFIQQKHKTEFNNGQVIRNQSTLKSLMKWVYTLLFFNTSTGMISNINIKFFLNNRIRLHRLTNLRPSKYIRDHRRLEPLNYCDHGLDIFEIRYKKILEYIRFSETNDSIFLTLDDLQGEKYCRSFLNKISKQYGLPLNEMNMLTRNLKTYSKDKNTNYSTNPNNYKTIISKNENIELEEHVKSLRFL